MRRRAGFTLVEMLVAVALVMFIMVILTEAFVAGLDTFSRLKAIGDMEERLRSASIALRRDLSADHFEGRRRLSDPNFWLQGPPREGFFRIWQPSALTLEGADAERIFSSRATNHALHFMVKLRGNRREDFLTANVPPGSPLVLASPDFYNQPSDARYQDTSGTSYNSQWAEVIYFLRSNGTTAGGTPLFALHRRQYLAVPDNRNLNWPALGTPAVPIPAQQFPNYFELSCKPFPPVNPQSLFFNTPTDLTVPQRRSGVPGVFPPANVQEIIPIGPNGTYPSVAEQNSVFAGADLLLTDVISFEVRVLLPESLDRIKFQPDLDSFVDLFDSVALANKVNPLGVLQSRNPLFGGTLIANQNPNLPRVFDTWSSVQDDVYSYANWNDIAPDSPPAVQVTRVPLPVRVLAIQITLRVWDVKSEQARQITLVQEM